MAKKKARKPARKAKTVLSKRKPPKRVSPIPAGYNTVTPYLCVADASGAIEFYKEVFGAKEKFRMGAPGGKVGHAEIRIGNSMIMIADEFPDMGAIGPKTVGGTPVTIHLYVPNVDAIAAKATAAGAKVLRDVANQFYGDRAGKFEDPWGHIWWISTHVEDVPPKELEARAKKMQEAA